MKKLLLHSVILAALNMSANADGFKSGALPVQVKQDTTQQSVEPLKVEAKDTAKENIALKQLEQHQDFIWEQEKINSAQTETNKHQEEVNQKLETTINKTIDAVNSKKSYSDDYNRLRNRIQDLEHSNDRSTNAINQLSIRVNTLERKAR